MKIKLLSLILGLLILNHSSAKIAPQIITFAYENYPPYEYLSDGQAAGIHVDIVRSICKKIGVKPVFINSSWKKVLTLAKSGQVDGIFSLNKTKEREFYLDFIDVPLSKTHVSLYSSSSCVEKPISSLKDVRGKTIGVVESYSYGSQFDQCTDFTRSFASSNEVLVKQLAKKWLGLIVINDRVLEFYKEKMGIKSIPICKHPVNIVEDHLYIAFSKNKRSRSISLFKDAVNRYASSD